MRLKKGDGRRQRRKTRDSEINKKDIKVRERERRGEGPALRQHRSPERTPKRSMAASGLFPSLPQCPAFSFQKRDGG